LKANIKDALGGMQYVYMCSYLHLGERQPISELITIVGIAPSCIYQALQNWVAF